VFGLERTSKTSVGVELDDSFVEAIEMDENSSWEDEPE
jgi:hypothetical protein